LAYDVFQKHNFEIRERVIVDGSSEGNEEPFTVVNRLFKMQRNLALPRGVKEQNRTMRRANILWL